MTPSVASLIALITTTLGLIINVLAVGAVVWHGGKLVGRVEEAMKGFSGDVSRLTTGFDRLTDLVQDLAGRVSNIEGFLRLGSRP